MDALQAISGRRSIRKYKEGDVSDDLVQQLLQAGMSAPSAGNEQPWHFIVLRDRQILNAVPNFHPFSKMLREAAVGIVVCGDLKEEVYKGYWVQDCSAAAQNILIAAHALGLGAVWLALYPMEDRVTAARKLLGFPEHVMPLCIISVGWPGEEKPPADRFRQDRVHRDRW